MWMAVSSEDDVPEWERRREILIQMFRQSGMVDAMRLNRTDTALVRVVIPIAGNDDVAAERSAVDFVQSFFGTLRDYLPA